MTLCTRSGGPAVQYFVGSRASAASDTPSVTGAVVTLEQRGRVESAQPARVVLAQRRHRKPPGDGSAVLGFVVENLGKRQAAPPPPPPPPPPPQTPRRWIRPTRPPSPKSPQTASRPPPPPPPVHRPKHQPRAAPSTSRRRERHAGACSSSRAVPSRSRNIRPPRGGRLGRH